MPCWNPPLLSVLRFVVVAGLIGLGFLRPIHAAGSEREILNQFFAQTEGAQWLSKDGWGTAAPICSWFGVTCTDDTSDQGVTAVRLPSNNVARQLPPQLFQLPFLQTLDLSDNPIQDANLAGLAWVDPNDAQDLGTPSPLQALDLSQCLLTNVDGLRFAADTLTELRLTKNQLAFFPVDIYELTNLQRLYINYNPMQGVLASQIGRLSSLQEFYAYSNRLSGSLPTEIGLLDKMQIFSMADNRLIGTIPVQVNNMLSLQVFSLHGGSADDNGEDGTSSSSAGNSPGSAAANGLTGPIPSFANAPRLAKLFLADNAFTGSLPQDFLEHNTLLDDFVLINLRNNQLTGGVPASLRHFNALSIDLVGNALTGHIPDYMCTRSQWMNGLVAAYGCDAILCHAGSYNDRGQQTSDNTLCRPCPPMDEDSDPSNLLGATSCPSLEMMASGESPVGGGTATDTGGLVNVDPARVLMNLYLQTDGPRWEQTSGWDILDMFLSTSMDLDQVPLDRVDYCGFYGVVCDHQFNVQFLTLPNNRLHGIVPPEVFRLPNLLSLDLSFNRVDLDFSTPATEGGGFAVLQHAPSLERLLLSHTSITRLDGISQGAPSLTSLYLDGTDLEQAMPQEIFALTKLEILHLEAAYLTGQLPSSIGELSNLKRLNLNENQIGGLLPTQLGLLTVLEYLDLSDNDFSGDLPTELGDMTGLWSLRINGARGGLGGALLPFDRLPNVRELEFAYNTFSGPIPSNFLAGTDRAIPVTVRLTGNNLSGDLPESLGTFTSMNLQVEDNQISGIPAALCAQTEWMDGEVGLTLPDRCQAILCPPRTWNPHGKASPTLGLVCEDCPGNTLYGETVCETGNVQKSRETEILDELFQATGGRYWNVTHTNWMKPGVPICQREGVICAGAEDADTGVTELRLSNFGLRGVIPSSVYELPQLRRLALSWNPVELNFTGIGDARRLEVLQLSGTKVDSVAGIEGASEILYEVHLASAGLEGTFPSALLEARSIRSLFMSDNRINGPIPTQISQLSNLELLKLDGNDISGSLPKEVGSLQQMEQLHLQGNKIMGLIPSELGNLLNLQDLDLSNQRGDLRLTGPLLPFSSNAQLTKINMAGNSLAGLLPTNLLDSVDKSIAITVDLTGNLLAGAIPIEYDAFQALTINLAENLIEDIPSELCDNTGWMGGAPPGSTSCDFILCPIQSVASTGRATASEACQPCPKPGQAPFFGSIECDVTTTDSERDVLVEFFRATGGDDWVYKEDWNTVLHVCTWYGIICNDDFSVLEIKLENNGLINENDDTDILQLLGRLRNLRKIDLKGNDLVLTLRGLPDDSNLQYLRVSGTELESLDGIGKAENLANFHAVDCGLTGRIPEEIYRLSNLKELYLSFNSLNGTIATTIGNLRQLEQLILYGNELSGTIPGTLGNLLNLKELVLGKNKLFGSIPSELSALENLEEVSFQDQQGLELIEGRLPDFASARNLWYVDVSANDITGEIPMTFLSGSNALNMSVMILLRDNELTGSVPESLLKFEDVFLDLAGNMISDIPAVFCQKSDWMYGQVGEIGNCDAILCPRGYYSDSGRQDDTESPCQACPGSNGEELYLGQTMCQLSKSEREILMEFFHDTGGSQWITTGSWGSSSPICSWTGVRCVGDQQDDTGVQVINLASNGLTGTIPASLWSLPQLQEVTLSGNDDLIVLFSGVSRGNSAIEVLDLANTRVESLRGIEEAGRLRELNVEEVGLGGEFPLQLLELHSTLEILRMSWNFMVGSLPASIGKLTMLKELELSGNDVHGPLPSSIGYMENLEKIRLDDTLISGILPAAEVSYLPKLVSFSASRDSKSGRPIFGPVPPFDKVPNLESLFLNGHDLSGPLPSSFLSASTYVRDVVLSDNAITGSLPLQMAAHTSINLELGNNRISNLPAQFCDNGKWMTGNVAALTESCDAILCRPGMASPYGRSIDAETQCEPCDGNDTTLAPYFGSTSCQSPPEPRAILAELFHACQGRQWYRNDYWMSSANVCDWYGVGCHNEEVVLINLDANNLRGRIPDSLFRLPKLQVLWLNSNRITLDFSNIGQAKNLMDLRLDSTGLRSIEGIGEAKSLTALSLSFNGLRGRFPAEDIFQLGNLRYLAMNSNSMTGLLPTSFANLRYLRTLKLDRNIFVGPIPSFDDSPSLTSLDLGSNELTGEIPHGLLAGVAIHTSSYMNINLSRNRLEGRVPESLDRFEQLNLDVTQNGLTEISPALCLKKDWNYGTVGRYGCSAILCPAQTSNEAGRQKDNLPCRSCRANDARHLGQAVCGTSASPSRKPSLWWAAGLSTALLLCLLWS